MGGFRLFFMVIFVFFGFYSFKHGILSTVITLIIVRLLLEWLGWWNGFVQLFIDLWR